MKCNQIQELILTDYLDGELSPELKTQLDRHIASCRECREFLSLSQKHLKDPFIESEQQFLRQDQVWQKIKSQINEEQTSPASSSWRENWKGLWGFIFVFFRARIVFSVVFVALLSAAVYFKHYSGVQMISRGEQTIQLIDDVADDLSGSTDEEANYGSAIENYFL